MSYLFQKVKFRQHSGSHQLHGRLFVPLRLLLNIPHACTDRLDVHHDVYVCYEGLYACVSKDVFVIAVNSWFPSFGCRHVIEKMSPLKAAGETRSDATVNLQQSFAVFIAQESL